MASFEDLQATLDEMMYGDAPASWEEIKAFLEKSTGVEMDAAQEEEIRQNYQREVEVLEIERESKENADMMRRSQRAKYVPLKKWKPIPLPLRKPLLPRKMMLSGMKRSQT